jgi:hypothetical protein
MHLVRTVREMLPESDLVQRAPPPGRVFSLTSIREILSFIIAANSQAMAARGDVGT